ncbi:MAG TPA: hypothetical protein VMR97_14840 [Acidimicrobiales bacterium]|nr:hypothetical protein [Acidimicrobiales bacterium]
MRLGKKAALAALCAGVVAVASAAWAGVALAASGGGFNPDQQDCPWNADAWNSPNGYVPPGCHDFAANVESGGTTNGDTNSNNTRYAEFGVDQSPNESNNPSFGFEENYGDPGTYDSPHSGCVSANTDGTGGGTGKGCGNNPKGAGFSATYDYYQLYCPIAGLLPFASTPQPVAGSPALYKCASDQPVGQNTITPDTGTDNALSTILSKGVIVYVGAFDNLDNGEHDGFSSKNNTNGAINGPSDGGAMTLSVIGPESIFQYLTSLVGSKPSPSQPEGVANASVGLCADSICTETTTQQQTVYYGCYSSSNPSTSTWTHNGVDGATNPQNKSAADKCAPGTAKTGNVYENNSPASTKEPYGCSGGGPDSSETACYKNQNGSPNPGGANAYRSGTPQQMNAEPGVQTYQDPDPQRSPALPFGTPGLYAGTCGVYANDGGGGGAPGITGKDPGYLGGVSNC